MKTRILSFDRTDAHEGTIERPDRHRELLDSLSSDGPMIARGAGLSYVAASSGEGVTSISSRLFNRFLSFDRDTGRVVVEPGVQVGELLELAIREGWYPPVLPGHPNITVGGCIAFNVHGKGQPSGGNFIRCVDRLWLYHPTHGELACSPSEASDLFELTVGGFGLTGFILRAELQLEPLPGRSVGRQRIPVRNLIEAVDVMRERPPTESLYSWNDLNRNGSSFGRGAVYSDRFQSDLVDEDLGGHRLDPRRGSKLPISLFNRLTIPAFCRGYGSLERLRSRNEEQMSVMRASFPIAGKELYYRLFGRKGFYEYQLLTSFDTWAPVVERVRKALGAAGTPVALGSLKLFSGKSSLLNFCGSGVCLTIDVAAGAAAHALFEALDRLVIEVGGIVNVAKDSRLEARTARRIFPHYESFKERIEAFDPQRRFDSSLRRRVLG